jgi:hypothetical protein
MTLVDDTHVFLSGGLDDDNNNVLDDAWLGTMSDEWTTVTWIQLRWMMQYIK